MYCQNCGNALVPNTTRCAKCGATILQQTPPPEGGMSIPPPPYLAPQYNPVPATAKSKLAAGLLGIFLGGFGVHRFYLGYTTIGVVQIIVTVVTCGVGHLWGFIEGILIIAGTTITTDSDGYPLTS